MANEPQSDLARYAFGYSDKKPGKVFWAIHVVLILYVLYKFLNITVTLT